MHIFDSIDENYLQISSLIESQDNINSTNEEIKFIY